jgi:hypothetical protein
LPHKAFALQIGQNHGPRICPTLFAHSSAAKSLIPFSSTQATIVLPYFARNLSADKKRGNLSSYYSILLLFKNRTAFSITLEYYYRQHQLRVLKINLYKQNKVRSTFALKSSLFTKQFPPCFNNTIKYFFLKNRSVIKTLLFARLHNK